MCHLFYLIGYLFSAIEPLGMAGRKMMRQHFNFEHVHHFLHVGHAFPLDAWTDKVIIYVVFMGGSRNFKVS